MNMKEKVIQGYRVSDVKVGEGAFGSVYLGYAENGERLAVKIISREQIDGTKSVIQAECPVSFITKFTHSKPVRANTL